MTELDSSRLGGGAIGGIVVGACASLLLILSCVFFWYRRRNGRPGPIYSESPSAAADHDTGPIAFHTPSLPTTVERYQPLSLSASSSSLLQLPSVPAPTPSPPQSNSSNADSRSRLVLHNPNTSFSGALGPVQGSAPASENNVPHQTRHVGAPAKSAFRFLTPSFVPFVFR